MADFAAVWTLMAMMKGNTLFYYSTVHVPSWESWRALVAITIFKILFLSLFFFVDCRHISITSQYSVTPIPLFFLGQGTQKERNERCTLKYFIHKEDMRFSLLSLWCDGVCMWERVDHREAICTMMHPSRGVRATSTLLGMLGSWRAWSFVPWQRTLVSKVWEWHAAGRLKVSLLSLWLN